MKTVTEKLSTELISGLLLTPDLLEKNSNKGRNRQSALGNGLSAKSLISAPCRKPKAECRMPNPRPW
ncbi:hypothetical protein [Flectobacillus roseus]|uniref:hypothetical protein n=1 Tax=Flectobacillus roseus TaxID=502259 RepID=UPI0024B64765|nr:hypothetical protein [Flectobacillus roseus]MDI9869581.1 hypothetical protein [Flectobacillus roseus]